MSPSNKPGLNRMFMVQFKKMMKRKRDCNARPEGGLIVDNEAQRFEYVEEIVKDVVNRIRYGKQRG